MSWERKSLEYLSSVPVRNGIYKSKEFQGRGARIINMKELFAYSFIGEQSMKRLELNSSEEEKFLVENDDLLFARRSLVEDGAGKTSIIKNLKENTTFESSMIRVRLDKKKCHPLFYYYYFNSYSGRGQVLSLSTGTNVKGIKGSSLKTLILPYPPLPTQKKIASILSAYDDLIENNLKRIKLLEEAAQRIYKEWFVDFKFPNHENTPINKETGLPQGWETKSFGSLLKKIARKGKLKKSEYISNGEYPVVDQGDGFIAGFSNNFEIIQDDNLPLVIFGDHTRRVKFIDFPFICGADGTQLLSPKDESLLPSFFYHLTNHIDLSNYAYARHFKFLKEHEVTVPENFLIERFNKKTNSILKQVNRLRFYNQHLKEARDLLLPRLMNRIIEV